MRVAARLGLVLVSAAVLQRGLFAELRITDASIDVLLLLAIAGGMVGGADRGAVVGFFAGLTLDLLVQTPLGLSALTYCLVGYVSGRLQGSIRRANRFLPSVLAALVSVGGVLAYAVLAEVIGRSGAVSERLLAVVLVVAVANAILIRPAMRVIRWAWPDETVVVPIMR